MPTLPIRNPYGGPNPPTISSQPFSAFCNFLNPSAGATLPVGYPAQDYDRSLDHISAAVFGNDRHALLGEIYLNVGDYDRGLGALQQALVLNPNDPTVLIKYGGNLWLFGRSKEAIETINRAYRLNPHHESYYDSYTSAFYVEGQYDEVIAKQLRRRGDIEPVALLDLVQVLEIVLLPDWLQSTAAPTAIMPDRVYYAPHAWQTKQI